MVGRYKGRAVQEEKEVDTETHTRIMDTVILCKSQPFTPSPIALLLILKKDPQSCWTLCFIFLFRCSMASSSFTPQ
jgi:hypothetical protein